PEPAGRRRRAREENQLRPLVAAAPAREDLRPGVLGVREDDRDELAVGVLLGRTRRRPARTRRDFGRGRGGGQQLQGPERVAAGQDPDDDRDDDQAAPAETDAASRQTEAP